MKTFVLNAVLLSALALPAFADDQPSIEAQCRAIAESHGVAADKLDSWMARCKERTTSMQQQMDEKNMGHGADGMQGMDHGAMGDMHGKSGEQGK
jgi:uncharacterized protein involved in copper resistance